MSETETEARVQETGRKLYELLGDSKPPAFKKDYWSGRLLEWCVRDEAFKVQMFRFVDVFPSLASSADIARHLQEYFGGAELNLPGPLRRRLLSMSPDSLIAKVAARVIGRNVKRMASQFIAGESAKDARSELRAMRKQGAAFTIALLGEAVVSEAEADEYAERYLEVLETLSAERDLQKPLGGGELDWGVSPPVNLSVKATALYSQLRPQAFEHSVAAAKQRLIPILRRAVSQQAFIHFDMEHRELKNLTLAIYKAILEDPEFRGYPHTGIAIQAYLRESLDDLRDLLGWSAERGQPLVIRLIKGAYWDQEVVHARQNNWPVPVFTEKSATDANFERAARLILEHDAPVRLACGSHNIRSIAFVHELAREVDAPVEFQALYGMAEPVKNALLTAGMPVRMYVPVGQLIPGIAYLVRRLLENTSNESFLLHSFALGEPPERLLRNPANDRLSPSIDIDRTTKRSFENEAPLDWTLAQTRGEFEYVLRALKDALPLRSNLLIGDRRENADTEIVSVDPSVPRREVAIAPAATIDQTRRAVHCAREAFPSWRDTDAKERANLLFRAAALMRERRLALAALQVFEVGKARSEADADVCEAIDFLEFYGREMLRLAETHGLGRAPGEDSRLLFEPRGVAAVIAPWNFPLAISTGMTSAALVAGNTVVYKPAEESVGTGAAMCDIFWEAGMPPGVLNFLPGDGAEIGGSLVGDPDVSTIAFTGSMEVGLEIIRRCGEVDPSADGIKKVIAEMGGKNAIVVDVDADFDVAVRDVIQSAFGYQGQKCSACSRLILPESIHDRFLRRLLPAVDSMRRGPAEDSSALIGPVVSPQAKQRIEKYIEIGRKEGQVAYQGPQVQGACSVPVTVLTGIERRHRVAQEEIFGPVLAVMKVKDFDEALEVANDSRFALTGGVFSRSPVNIEKARRRFRVGNLYINRSCTGAIVERHPFGGFRLSGLGTKSGGQDYLREFLLARTVTESTLRQGFAPH